MTEGLDFLAGTQLIISFAFDVDDFSWEDSIFIGGTRVDSTEAGLLMNACASMVLIVRAFVTLST